MKISTIIKWTIFLQVFGKQFYAALQNIFFIVDTIVFFLFFLRWDFSYFFLSGNLLHAVGAEYIDLEKKYEDLLTDFNSVSIEKLELEDALRYFFIFF